MTARRAKVTEIEVRRLIKAVRAAGLPIARVTFDGDRVDVVVGGKDSSPTAPAPKPETFQSWDEYDAWKATQRESRD